MFVSGQYHVCKPPPGQPAGTLWRCPDCNDEYVLRPVAVSELGGRVLNLWVLHYEAPMNAYVAPHRRGRNRKATP
jgi:hypothetical protein